MTKKQSDLEKFEDLYVNVGIRYRVSQYTNGESIMEITCDGNNKINGHDSSYMEIYFDKNGKFVQLCLRD